MSDAFWQAMGPVLVALIGGPLLILVRRPERPPPAPATTPAREDLERRHNIDASGLDERLVTILDRQDVRFDQQAEELREVRGMFIDARVHATEIHDWIDEGMPTPPGAPKRPWWANYHRT